MPRKGSFKPICLNGHDKRIVGITKNNNCIACKKFRYDYLTDRKHHLKKRYNITLEDYNKLFINQNGMCLGCYKHQNQLNKKLFIDHSHKTGKVRGLLCQWCNFLVGALENYPDRIAHLSEYIKTHEY